MNERKEPGTTPRRTRAPQGTRAPSSTGTTTHRTSAPKSTRAATSAASTTRKQITQQVDKKSTELGKQVASAAEAVRGVGKQLRDQPGIAKATEQLADRVDGLAGYLSEGSADQLWRDIRNLANREPLAFAGACFAVGLLAGRIVKAATSDRNEASQGSSTASASRNGRSSGGGTGSSTTGARTGSSTTRGGAGSGSAGRR